MGGAALNPEVEKWLQKIKLPYMVGYKAASWPHPICQGFPMPNDLMLRARISPKGHLDLLSRQEVTALLQVNSGPLARIFRNCSLAVLNHDEYQIDDDQALLERYPDYEVQVIQDERGIKLELRNAPAAAFVDGELIRGINEHLFSVLRDLVRDPSAGEGEGAASDRIPSAGPGPSGGPSRSTADRSPATRRREEDDGRGSGR